MGRYGNIDGISTLSESSIAKDSVRGTIGKILAKREFEIRKNQNVVKSSDKK
nr:MAG TPA: hypothetical protein [Caudoviricetes sp.]